MAKIFFNKEVRAGVAIKHQLSQISSSIQDINSNIDILDKSQKENSKELEALIDQAEKLCAKKNVKVNSQTDFSEIDSILDTISVDSKRNAYKEINKLETVEVSDSWESYLNNIDSYIEKNEINIAEDPFDSLLSIEEKKEIAQRLKDDYMLAKAPHCDKWDYILAASCGVVCGLIDAFFVGMPSESKLGTFTDKMADSMVCKFTDLVYKADKKLRNSGNKHKADVLLRANKVPKKKPEGIASCIGYLEARFKVSYDARYVSDLKGAEGHVNFGSTNHHLKSLAHCPDLVGLFFAILDQFTHQTTIISNGRLASFDSKSETELYGDTFVEKLVYGFINWLGHMMSDIAGGSGSRGGQNPSRGSGLAMPFFEFFQLFNSKKFKFKNDIIDNKNQESFTLADITSKMFQNGYDARFAAAQAIPVTLNEVLVRICWAIKQHYYHEKDWKNCIPLHLSDKPELRRMLLVGHGALCLVDGIDAGVRCEGQIILFAMRLNYVGWTKFANMAFMEIRALYKENAIDVETLDVDLEREWNQILIETQII